MSEPEFLPASYRPRRFVPPALLSAAADWLSNIIARAVAKPAESATVMFAVGVITAVGVRAIFI